MPIFPYMTDNIPAAFWAGVAVITFGVIVASIVSLIRGSVFPMLDRPPFFIYISFLALGSVTMFSISSSGEDEMNVMRQQWMQQTYGISFTPVEYERLDFPVDTKPAAEEEEETYGLTAGTIDNQTVVVQLIWENGTYYLTDTDGERLKPLK